MIDRHHGPSLGRQAKALGIRPGSVHSLPRPPSEADLALMRRTCELHLDYLFAGSRMLNGLLKAEGHEVGRSHGFMPMKKMAVGRPEVFNGDQGSQFTSADFIKLLKTAEIAIRRGGKGAWRDNV